MELISNRWTIFLKIGKMVVSFHSVLSSFNAFLSAYKAIMNTKTGKKATNKTVFNLVSSERCYSPAYSNMAKNIPQV